LGLEIEWVADVFPYTITAHPQHIGIALAWLSFIPLGGQEMIPIAVAWLILYAFQTAVESYTGQTEHDALKKRALSKNNKKGS
jgi:hypothetical protein